MAENKLQTEINSKRQMNCLLLFFGLGSLTIKIVRLPENKLQKFKFLIVYNYLINIDRLEFRSLKEVLRILFKPKF